MLREILSDKGSASIGKVELEAQGPVSGKLDLRSGGLAVPWKTGADIENPQLGVQLFLGRSTMSTVMYVDTKIRPVAHGRGLGQEQR